MKNKLIIFPFSIILGEYLILNGKIIPGLSIHIITILAIIILLIFGEFSVEIKSILQSLILLPLLQTINLSIPPLFVKQNLIGYGIIFIPIYIIFENQKNLTKIHDIYNYLPLSSALISIILVKSNQSQYFQYNLVYGEIMTILLIIILLILFLIPRTIYSDRYNRYTLFICSIPLLLTFLTIIIFKINLIINGE